MAANAPARLTADELTFALERWLVRRGADVVLPNVIALGEHETDVLVLTSRGYLHEIEIKLTTGDFRAEQRAKPPRPKWRRLQVLAATAAGEPAPTRWVLPFARGGTRRAPDAPDLEARYDAYDPVAEYRAGLNALRAPTCPNRYSYAYPADLADRLDPEVPAWAGVIHLHTIHGRPLPTRHRRPPLLHRAEAPAEVVNRMWRSAYNRFWAERRRRLEAEHDRDRYRRHAP